MVLELFSGGFRAVLCFGADDFPESTGVKRIVQALNANVWSNVVMKGGRCPWASPELCRAGGSSN